MNYMITCHECNKVFSTTNEKALRCRSCIQKEASIKRKKTYIEKYGVDNPSKVPEVIDKITDTFMNRYGVKRAVHVPEFQEKMKQTMQDRYGVDYYVQSEEYTQNGHFRISNANKRAIELLNTLKIDHTVEMPIDTKTYDIAIKDMNILIEINPSYTHSALGNHWNKDGIPNTYHVEKSAIAKYNNYRCIHIWDWDNLEQIIQSLVITHTIYARQCEIREVDITKTDSFLNDNHFQGTCKGHTLSIGLYQNDELLQIMTFGKPRYNKKYTWELMRLCSKRNYRIVGGASKLFKHAIATYNIANLISYCDASKFDGRVYETIGMSFVTLTAPQEVWSKGNKYVTANYLRKHGADRILGTNFGKGTNNEQIMIDNGWLPVYDCGQLVFEYNTDNINVEAVPSDYVYTGTYKKLKEKQERNCKYCGKVFTPNSNSQQYCKGPHYHTCPVCGKETEVTNNEKLKKAPTACSYECRVVRTRQTSLDRYGCTAPGNSPAAREKAKETTRNHYGTDYAMQSEVIRKKSEQTLLKRYGVTNTAHRKETIEKRKETLRKNQMENGKTRGIDNPDNVQEEIKKIKDNYTAYHSVSTPLLPEENDDEK